MELPEFLLARVAEAEADAHAAAASPWAVTNEGSDPETRYVESYADEVRPVAVAGAYAGIDPADAAHIARWDPAHVLAWCAAVRAVVAKYERACHQAEHDDADFRDTWDEIASTLEQVVMLFAQPFADHPDFDPAWR